MPNARVPAAATGLPSLSPYFPPGADRTPGSHAVGQAMFEPIPPASPRTPREALEAAITAAIDLLDCAEMLDVDLEEGADLEADAVDEPSLGSPNDYHGSAAQTHWGAGTPVMAWDADLEGPDDELEPSLGSIDQPNQSSWGFAGNDQELEDEHDGGEPDEDGEPSHGSTSTMNQEYAWAPCSDFWGSGEGEPSLALTGNMQMVPRGYDRDREYDVADAPHDAENDCDETERLGDRPDALAPCLDQCVDDDVYRGVVHHPRSLEAIAREQRAMQRSATRLHKIVQRLKRTA